MPVCSVPIGAALCRALIATQSFIDTERCPVQMRLIEVKPVHGCIVAPASGEGTITRGSRECGEVTVLLAIVTLVYCISYLANLVIIAF